MKGGKEVDLKWPMNESCLYQWLLVLLNVQYLRLKLGIWFNKG